MYWKQPTLAALGLPVFALAWDPEALCRNFPTAPGECGLLTFTGVSVTINPGGIGNDVTSPGAILFGDTCNVLDGKEWEPTNPGFYYSWTTPGNNLIEARTVNIGADAIAEAQITINQIEPAFIIHGGIASFTEGLTATWYRQVNFLCSV
jgi:hypothetical protein